MIEAVGAKVIYPHSPLILMQLNYGDRNLNLFYAVLLQLQQKSLIN